LNYGRNSDLPQAASLQEFVVIEATDGEECELQGAHAIRGHSPSVKTGGLE
jgi:hypothetical protein